MGSLPDLTERARPAPAPRPAARTVSDPHRHRVHQQPPPTTVQVREWKWKRPSRTPAPAIAVVPRRRESCSSSVGAASVKRLLRKAPPKPPHAALRRFTALCVSRAISAAAILPLTAVAGAEGSAAALALMHAIGAATAPLSPVILRKLGSRIVVSAAHTLMCLLLCGHALGLSEMTLLPLYAAAGIGLVPLTLTYGAAATATAHALAMGSRDDDGRRKVVLRRALRALRGAQDAGLFAGALLLGGAVAIWPSEYVDVNIVTVPPTNRTVARWPPPEDYFQEDDFEERICGASGCPGDETFPALTDLGRRTLFSTWSVLALIAVGLGTLGASSSRPPPPAEAAAPMKAAFKDTKLVLEAPMALFIGLQEGFIYTSYIKWYAVCVGGWGAAWSALAGAGALQALAAATLSMAAARGRRGALAAGGAAAHACLLLALLRWRAAKTDQALPAVAAAAWGACGALWDTLQTGSVVGGQGWRASWSLLLAARHAGIAAACGARQLLCVRAQLATLAVSLAFAISTHAAKEIKTRRAAAAAEREREPE